MYLLFDKKISITAINTDLKRVSLNEPVAALWTDDAIYAEYLPTPSNCCGSNQSRQHSR